MNVKKIQGKLKVIRDHVEDHGALSIEDRNELNALLEESLLSAQEELRAIQGRLHTLPVLNKADNDNRPLSDEQERKLSIMEKTGTGSRAIH